MLSLSINPIIKAGSLGTSKLIKEMAIVVSFQFHFKSLGPTQAWTPQLQQNAKHRKHNRQI